MRKQKSDRNEKGKSGERTKPKSENAREGERGSLTSPEARSKN